LKGDVMAELKEFLKEIISLPGLSGYEAPVREIVSRKWEPLVDEMRVSRLGSLEALKHGSGSEPRHTVLLAGHMDAIGLMVTQVVGRFLHMTSVGGVDPRVLPGQPVVVHGRKALRGVVIQPPDNLLEDHKSGAPVGLEDLYVDAGVEAEELAQLVHPGCIVSFDQTPVELGGELLAGHTMDDRSAVAAITHCLEILKKRIHSWDVWAVATVQEEVGVKGALTSGFGLNPDIAIAIDVTHAKGPGTSEKSIADLGKGVVISQGPNIHPGLFRRFMKLVKELEITYQMEVDPAHSGTDAIALQVARGGRASIVLSIPLRYMHTPVEVVSMKDIRRTGRLLAEFITGLDEKTLDELREMPG
jgi:putative aminopeptidase FrvX